MPSEQAVFVTVVLVETRRIRNANMGNVTGLESHVGRPFAPCDEKHCQERLPRIVSFIGGLS